MNQKVILARLDMLSADDHCHIEQACQYARQAATEALYTRNGPSSPVFNIEQAAAYAPGCMGAAI